MGFIDLFFKNLLQFRITNQFSWKLLSLKKDNSERAAEVLYIQKLSTLREFFEEMSYEEKNEFLKKPQF